MVILLFLAYMSIGLTWLYLIHNKIVLNNMMQPLVAIVFWPIHILMFIFGYIWR